MPVRSALTISIVGAIAALLGSAMGGAATYLTTQQSLRAESQRQERQDAYNVRGAARLLIRELLDADTYTLFVHMTGSLTPYLPQYSIEVTDVDYKLVMARLTAQQYSVVTGAMTTSREVESIGRHGRIRRNLPPSVVDVIGRDAHAIRLAINALRPLAQLPSDVPYLPNDF
jgi:hypothetical protein